MTSKVIAFLLNSFINKKNNYLLRSALSNEFVEPYFSCLTSPITSPWLCSCCRSIVLLKGCIILVYTKSFSISIPYLFTFHGMSHIIRFFFKHRHIRDNYFIHVHKYTFILLLLFFFNYLHRVKKITFLFIWYFCSNIHFVFVDHEH